MNELVLIVDYTFIHDCYYSRKLKIYVTFGTRAWQYFTELNFTPKDPKMLKRVEDD